MVSKTRKRKGTAARRPLRKTPTIPIVPQNNCDDNNTIRADLHRAIANSDNLPPGQIHCNSAKMRNQYAALFRTAGIECWVIDSDVYHSMSDLVAVNAILCELGDPLALALAKHL